VGYKFVQTDDELHLEFHIKDTGIGIPESRQKAIFNSFVQADIEDRKALQGTGIGLSIAKAYVNILGGKIWVESSEGKGSAFFFIIPVKPVKPKEKEMTRKELAEKSTIKIVVAEDDEPSFLHLSILLKNIAGEIIQAKNGVETVEICKTNPDTDIILMDIKMPVMDGYDATQKIREFNKKVIIIAQTAYALAGDREKAIEAGCNDYISKPVKKEDLMALIEKYTG
jgi:CheY-like chemotaxis protein